MEQDDIRLLSNHETRIRRLPRKPHGMALEKRTKMDACLQNEVLQEQLPELWVILRDIGKNDGYYEIRDG